MTNNDVLRSLRYMLGINNQKIVSIYKLTGLQVSEAEIHNFLKGESEEGFMACPDPFLAQFLDALIILKRGRDDDREPLPLEIPMSNNQVIKKLRVALHQTLNPPYQ